MVSAKEKSLHVRVFLFCFSACIQERVSFNQFSGHPNLAHGTSLTPFTSFFSSPLTSTPFCVPTPPPSHRPVILPPPCRLSPCVTCSQIQELVYVLRASSHPAPVGARLVVCFRMWWCDNRIAHRFRTVLCPRETLGVKPCLEPFSWFGGWIEVANFVCDFVFDLVHLSTRGQSVTSARAKSKKMLKGPRAPKIKK